MGATYGFAMPTVSTCDSMPTAVRDFPNRTACEDLSRWGEILDVASSSECSSEDPDSEAEMQSDSDSDPNDEDWTPEFDNVKPPVAMPIDMRALRLLRRSTDETASQGLLCTMSGSAGAALWRNRRKRKVEWTPRNEADSAAAAVAQSPVDTTPALPALETVPAYRIEAEDKACVTFRDSTGSPADAMNTIAFPITKPSGSPKRWRSGAWRNTKRTHSQDIEDDGVQSPSLPSAPHSKRKHPKEWQFVKGVLEP